MNFKEKVQSMSGKEIVMAMVSGLQKEHVKVNMQSYGTSDYLKGICYGCAATNAVCEIIGKTYGVLDVGHPVSRAVFVETDVFFLQEFESAINWLRGGRIFGYNSVAYNIGIALLKDSDKLPVLRSDNYKENLQFYIDYANTL